MKKRIQRNRTYAPEVWVKRRFAFAQHSGEEKWLEEMAAKGLHLDWAGVGGYAFKKGPPAIVMYMADFISDKWVTEDLEQAHREEGWEPVCSVWGRHYFRYTGMRAPEKRHCDIPQFIRDERGWVAFKAALSSIPVLGAIVPVAILNPQLYEPWEYILVVLFNGGFCTLIFLAEFKYFIRRAGYLWGLKKALKRGEIE